MMAEMTTKTTVQVPWFETALKAIEAESIPEPAEQTMSSVRRAGGQLQRRAGDERATHTASKYHQALHVLSGPTASSQRRRWRRLRDPKAGQHCCGVAFSYARQCGVM